MLNVASDSEQQRVVASDCHSIASNAPKETPCGRGDQTAAGALKRVGEMRPPLRGTAGCEQQKVSGLDEMCMPLVSPAERGPEQWLSV